jgi:hypothetical protein
LKEQLNTVYDSVPELKEKVGEQELNLTLEKAARRKGESEARLEVSRVLQHPFAKLGGGILGG